MKINGQQVTETQFANSSVDMYGTAIQSEGLAYGPHGKYFLLAGGSGLEVN